MASALRPGHASAQLAPGARAGIIRFQDRVAFFIVDPASGLMSFHGIDTPWSALCSGAPPVFDPFSIQLIDDPAGTLHALIQGQEHTVFIYPARELGNRIGLEACSFMATLPILASGRARLTRTDNDLTGSLAAGANAYGWSATGSLTKPNGEVVPYHEVVRGLILPGQDPSAPPRDLQTQIRLGP